jgi:hypothetical protein
LDKHLVSENLQTLFESAWDKSKPLDFFFFRFDFHPRMEADRGLRV